MKLLVGLGNPGEKYVHTRHNVGFMFLEWLAKGEVEWKHNEKLFGKVGEIMQQHEKLLLLKPQTFMNDSGKAVSAVANFYNIPHSHIVVVHDDLDIVFGSYKIQTGRGPKVHNGLLSIEQHIKDIGFMRVRIGVDGRDQQNRVSGESYVLQNFTKEELEVLYERIFVDIAEEIKNQLK
ncbi:MAG: Peptidyl-tRNA hydrolase [Microgenomates bacterium OLB23]|nr:MAG: Peptidyl-tRNA hydrolase [Microgenomates bacterium OLB23]